MRIPYRATILIILGLLLAALFGLPWAAAQTVTESAPQPPPIHPQFALLDENGASVLATGNPVSTLKTCGACHDTAFIQSHSYHSSLGLDEFARPDRVTAGRAWDSSAGAFGRWDPLRYRYLSLAGDPLLDLGTPEWVMDFGDRHVGGGPALVTRDGRPLSALSADVSNPETAALEPTTGQVTAWDWAASGTVEMNCFLCHLPNPNNTARIAALQSGQFRWANTATLLGTGLVEANGKGYRWNADAFAADGQLKTEFITVQDPSNANCGQCHGLVHTDAATPVTLTITSSTPWSTLTTGQIIAGQRISASGLNLAGKADLTRPWDVHAARQVKCTECHFSLNNPIYFRESANTRPDHLAFDPRRLSLGEYVQQPLHDFAKGPTAQHAIAPELTDTMRRCDSCHNAASTHQWLPYTDRHLSTVACETCHIPRLYAPALQSVDWTVLTANAQPRREYRGVDGDPQAASSLITGFQPALLPRQDVDGKTRLAPHNLVTAWYWVYGDPARPVRLQDLKAAWFDGSSYAAEVVAALDADQNGALTEAELVLNSAAKQRVIAGRLAALGLANPRIAGDVQPYTISHDVANGEWVTRACTACHSADSRLAQSFTIAAAGPTGIAPALLAGSSTVLNGSLVKTADGALRYQPSTEASKLYIFGQSSAPWVDWFGMIAFVGTLLAVAAHGGLRFTAALRLPKHTPQLKQVYVYAVYERFWHWLQTFTILGLIFSGLIIHKPDIFGIFAFKSVVQVHNVLAAIVVINAALSLFYHLASGEIKQFIPRPAGFYDQAIIQAKFYLRGIFKNEPHPFEKAPQRKLNPLQQITYFGLLNLLLPGQVITGALMWGAQRWPDLALRLGGLPLLAPVHSLIAWLLAAFVVLHVYLTTTGHTPLASIQAMMNGWDLLETHDALPAPIGSGDTFKLAQEAPSHGN
jgi:thiosulfate reductase cytochrome b subunit